MNNFNVGDTVTYIGRIGPAVMFDQPCKIVHKYEPPYSANCIEYLIEFSPEVIKVISEINKSYGFDTNHRDFINVDKKWVVFVDSHDLSYDLSVIPRSRRNQTASLIDI